ncbi:MAG: hypothetical protein KF816_06330 [Melioribacteraceae bacterium]|nr:hypothetical protein [Melioribacteraceae bacterium]
MNSLKLRKEMQNIVLVLAWGLLIISVFLLLRNIVFLNSISSMINFQQATKNFIPPVEINFTLYFIQAGFEFLLYVTVFLFSTFLLKYQNKWRKRLIIILVVAIIFYSLSPQINYYNIDKIRFHNFADTKLLFSYIWSIVLSTWFLLTIRIMMKEEIKLLFK